MLAKKRPKRWAYSPPGPAQPSDPATVRAEVEAKVRELIDTVLMPQHVKPPPKNNPGLVASLRRCIVAVQWIAGWGACNAATMPRRAAAARDRRT
jgi:hypothetical protein